MSNRITPEQARTAYAQARCLFNEEQVENAIVQMAAKISARLSEKNPLVISVMNGGLILTGKIVTKLDFPLHLDYLHATRYRGATHGGELHWVVKPQHSLRDRHVLFIDDILDEGVTLNAILKYCRAEGRASSARIRSFSSMSGALTSISTRIGPRYSVHESLERSLSPE